MKAILEFNIDDFDDKMSHKQCIKANDMALAIWEFSSNSKRTLEDELASKDIDKYETLDLVFKMFYDILDEHSININELTI